jgi:hypothetical protein
LLTVVQRQGETRKRGEERCVEREERRDEKKWEIEQNELWEDTGQLL